MPSGYAGVQSASSFAQWFTDNPINYPIQQTLTLTESSGTFAYSTNAYYPIDDEGFGKTVFRRRFDAVSVPIMDVRSQIANTIQSCTHAHAQDWPYPCAVGLGSFLQAKEFGLDGQLWAAS